MTRNSLVVLNFNTESGGRPYFHEYIKTIASQIAPDVIAFQEVHHCLDLNAPRTFMPKDPGRRIYPLRLHLFLELKELLGNEYISYFAPHLQGVHDFESCEYDVHYGQALFVHSRCNVNFFRSDMIYGRFNQFNTEKKLGTPAGKIAVGASLNLPSGEKLVLTNVHGFTSTKGKVDMPERFNQNSGINYHLNRIQEGTKNKAFVLCVGDLNYRSDMKALEDLRVQSAFGYEGGVVLNHKFDVYQTRNKNYTNLKNEPEADFMIVCRDLGDKAVYLKTDYEAASDHAAMIGRFIFD